MLENTKWRSAREEHTKEEVGRFSGARFRESKHINLENGVQTAGARIFSWFGEYDLHRKNGMQESQTEKGEMRQQQRMKTMADVNSWWVSGLLAAD